MQEALINILNTFLYVFITALTGYAVAYIKQRLGVEKMKKAQELLLTHKEIALDAVRFVEQRYEGEEKLQRAMEQLSTHSAKMGVHVDAELLEGLIESALRELKDSFGEEWGRAIKK